MQSIRLLLKSGPGPSSSHTIGPMKATRAFLEMAPNADSYEVELWGSLALTGKGHLTDYIIEKTFEENNVHKHNIVFKANYTHPFHPNGLKFTALDSTNHAIKSQVYFSIGGGFIIKEGESLSGSDTPVYKHRKFSEILKYVRDKNIELWQYVEEWEGKEIFDYLKDTWEVMKKSVEDGLVATEVIPGSIKLKRRSKEMFDNAQKQTSELKDLGELFAYTLAVSEQNASGNTIITAPTCGAAGVLPGLLYYFYKNKNISEGIILKAMAIAGLVGLVIKENATISGAEGGCQAEVGSACCMASAAAVYMLGGTLEQLEYAAEMAIEHHLGLTCDPVDGLVQIPCIERNAVAVRRALDNAYYAMFTDGIHSVSLDTSIKTMLETGKDLKAEYRETSLGGLATNFKGSKC